MSAATYPARLEARVKQPLSRWLWLVKWILVSPHLIVLGCLWVASIVLSVIAFITILFTERYPRTVFDFNAGVKRWLLALPHYLIVAFFAGAAWSWPSAVSDFVSGMDRWVLRVAAYVSLMTDQHPPFRPDMGEREPAGA